MRHLSRITPLTAVLVLAAGCSEQGDSPLTPEVTAVPGPVPVEAMSQGPSQREIPIFKSHIAPPPGSVTISSLAGDVDNFGYGLGNPMPCVFFDNSGPGDLGVFDRELFTSGDHVESWTHDFTGDPNWAPGFETLVVMLEVREAFSDNTRSTIEIDGNLLTFTASGFARCGTLVQEFSFTGPAASFADDGIVNVTFRENGDDIGLDWARLTVYGVGEITVDVDVMPGSARNPINPRSKGVIPVAVLSDGDFDATTIDASTVAFGPGGAAEAHGKGHVEDVDGDGVDDMLFHFDTGESGLACGDTEATLTGQTTDGKKIKGTDSVDVKCR